MCNIQVNLGRTNTIRRSVWTQGWTVFHLPSTPGVVVALDAAASLPLSARWTPSRSGQSETCALRRCKLRLARPMPQAVPGCERAGSCSRRCWCGSTAARASRRSWTVPRLVGAQFNAASVATGSRVGGERGDDISFTVHPRSLSRLPTAAGAAASPERRRVTVVPRVLRSRSCNRRSNRVASAHGVGTRSSSPRAFVIPLAGRGPPTGSPM